MYTLNGWWFLSSGGAYPLVFTVVCHIFTTLQYTFKTLQELFRHNKYVLLLFY